MEIKQYDIYWVDLEPTQGVEINKIRPCVVISPDEMNDVVKTVVIVPMTTKSKAYPTRIEISFNGKTGYIVVDQIRSLDKTRLKSKAGSLDQATILKLKSLLKEFLVD